MMIAQKEQKDSTGITFLHTDKQSPVTLLQEWIVTRSQNAFSPINPHDNAWLFFCTIVSAIMPPKESVGDLLVPAAFSFLSFFPTQRVY